MRAILKAISGLHGPSDDETCSEGRKKSSVIYSVKESGKNWKK